jgi:predicted metalloprotease
VVRARGQTEDGTIDAFLTRVLTSVDRYWTRTMAANDLPEPRVGFNWIAPGQRGRTRCGAVADDSAAFYCPTDDTIYIAQRFAADLYDGVLRGLPGQESGAGRAAGDFGVAYVVAHEYAHNIQHELDLFTVRPSRLARPFELQADCLAGTWANSVYREGLLEEGDVEEAIQTALAVGDFDVGAEQHHGTPEERREAWSAGFDSGDPGICSRYLPA